MKWLLLAGMAAVLSGTLAVAAGRRVAGGDTRYRGLGRTAWFVATTLVFVVAIVAAHSVGVYTVPLVAFGFVAVAVPARSLLTARSWRRRRREPPASHGAGHRDAALGPSARTSATSRGGRG